MENRKILKAVLIIVMLSLILVVAYWARNFIILNKIVKMQEKISSSDNYSYIIEFYDNNKEDITTTVQCYYKDGKMLKTVKLEDDSSRIVWHDENTKEGITLNSNELTATIDVYGSNFNFFDCDMEMQMLTPARYTNILEDSLTVLIGYDKIDGKECYFVQPLMGVVSSAAYYEKNDGPIVKYTMGNYIEGGKKYYGSKIEYKNLKSNEVTDNDVLKPDLTGYTLIDNR